MKDIVFSQPSAQPDFTINTFWDFYSNNRLATLNAGKGYTGIAGTNDVSGITLNPASLDLSKKFQLHCEYVYKSDVPWETSSGFNDMNLKTVHPSFLVGGAYKITDFLQTGLLWYTMNSSKLDMGETTITNEFGEEIGKTDMANTMSISSLMLPVVYNYKNKFKAGVNLIMLYYHGNINYVTTESQPDKFQNANADEFNFNAQLGLIYSPIKNLSVGATFTPQVIQRFKWKFDDGNTFTAFVSNIFPMKIGLGAQYNFINFPLRMAVDYNYTNSSRQDGLKDRNDVNIGFEYDFLKHLTVRTGFFTLKDNRQNGTGFEYNDPPGKYDQYFLSLGFTYRLKKFSFSAVLLDSHISSGLIKQTLVNGGITMDF